MDQFFQALLHLTEPQVVVEYSKYLLLLVAIYSFVEVVFPAIPGDALLVLSGSIAGRANISPVGLIAMALLGGFIGSVIVYDLGNRLERRLLDSPRLAHLIDSKAFGRVERWFKHYGYLTLLFSRFIPVVRTGIILTAGMVNLDRRKSLAVTGASILLYTMLLILGGRYIGRRWEKVVALWQAHFRVLLFSAAVLLVGYIIWVQLRKVIKKSADDKEQ